MYIVEQRKMEH